MVIRPGWGGGAFDIKADGETNYHLQSGLNSEFAFKQSTALRLLNDIEFTSIKCSFHQLREILIAPPNNVGCFTEKILLETDILKETFHPKWLVLLRDSSRAHRFQ